MDLLSRPRERARISLRLENECAEQVCFGRISVNVADKFRVVASVDKGATTQPLGSGLSLQTKLCRPTERRTGLRLTG